MASTFHGIETARRSLFTQQVGLNTLGHNIANANTEGYTRQRVTIQATRPMEAIGMMHSTAAGQLGTGVEAKAITRIRTAFLDEQFRDENTAAGSWQIRSETMSKLETIVNEPSDTGLRTTMDQFWTAWSDLSKDPENITNREIVKQSALSLVDAFNQTSKQLQNLSSDLTDTVSTKATQANTILSAISDLNLQIRRIEAIGDHANDLRDQRDLYVDQLSHLVNVSVTETSNSYTVRMGNVDLITEDNVVNPLSAASLDTAYASGDLQGGEIHGTYIALKEYVASYQTKLNLIASTLANGTLNNVQLPNGAVVDNQLPTAPATIQGINGLHKLGYTNEAGVNPAGDFFVFDTSGGDTGAAGTIRLNPDIIANANKIATSMRSTVDANGNASVVAGNNTLALLMSQLKDTRFTFDETDFSGETDSTVSSFYNAMVGGIGIQAQEALRQYDNASALVTQVDSSRQSVSSVSLDEEMSNMIVFQNAYNAAARFMTVMDEALDKLINGTGTVGR